MRDGCLDGSEEVMESHEQRPVHPIPINSLNLGTLMQSQPLVSSERLKKTTILDHSVWFTSQGRYSLETLVYGYSLKT
jgi:hypothetical protein